ncbi:hypothetical protein [Thiocapsa sp. N5-Cardenillas]|uniref:hypothetical protein n=1 Tax=Thiocapsa sp. N5-Cardenillas TaxID=3137397 RepID=UPI0035B0DFBB
MPKHSDPTIKQHKITFRPIEPPDDLPNYDNWRRVCVPVPAPFIPYLLNLLRVYLWQGRWDADPATAALAVQAWNDLVHQFVIAGDCENMIILRQKPTNNCILEQSHDGGLTWSKAFDYSLCKPKMSYTEINNTYSDATTIYNDILNRYDGTATSLMPYAGDTDEPVRDSLCLCTRIFLSAVSDMVVTLKKQADEQGDSDLNSLAAAFGAGSSVAGGIAGLAASAAVPAALVAAAPFLVFGLAAGSLGLIVAQAFNDTDLSVYEDQAAWDELACIMYQGLKDRPINQLVFSESISSQTPESANAQELQTQIQPFFDDLQLYLMFLDAWAKAREIFVLEPNVWDCPCEEDTATWSQTFDFTVSSGNWQAVDGGTGRAQYIAGAGWRRGTGINFVRFQVQTVAAISTTITSVAATYSRQNWALHSTGRLLISPSSPTVIIAVGGSVLTNWFYDSSDLIMTGQRFTLDLANSAGNTFPAGQEIPSDLYLTSVTLTGLGVNPFA